MNTIDFIRSGLELNKMMTIGLIDDMKDSPTLQPTSKGGNHPLWVLGHVTYAESNIIEHIILGNENPLIEWKAMFGSNSEPTDNAEHYLPWDEVRAKFDDVRARTLSVLDSLTEEDLDKPSKNCPPGREQLMGTIGSCLLMLTLHPMMHCGQVADARRMAGRSPLMG